MSFETPKAHAIEMLQEARRLTRSGNAEKVSGSHSYDADAPRVVVLVGIPGSGKTTFGKQLEERGWGLRVSQDDLGTRSAVERAFVAALKAGTNVVVDRCNFDAAQRKHWIDYARARGSPAGVIVFCVPFDECLQRVRTRASHPTLPPTSESDSVVLKMANSFTFPNRNEGFIFCRIVRGPEDFNRVLEEVQQAG